MESTGGKTMLGLMALLLAGAAIFSCVYYLMTPGDRIDSLGPVSEPERERLVLFTGKVETVGGLRLIYRGLHASGRFRLDVVIPELDPGAFYENRIEIESARTGFSLADRRFRLISAGKRRLKLWYLKTPVPVPLA